MGIIAWNIPNMITVILMALVGYVVLALAAQAYMSMSGSTSSSTGTGNTTLNWASNLRNLA